uniref:Uncharacterized protein n=1 Tax=Arundo donax TaxID=35708 RepID=A0A0A8YJY8_ARUDO
MIGSQKSRFMSENIEEEQRIRGSGGKRKKGVIRTSYG